MEGLLLLQLLVELLDLGLMGLQGFGVSGRGAWGLVHQSSMKGVSENFMRTSLRSVLPQAPETPIAPVRTDKRRVIDTVKSD